MTASKKQSAEPVTEPRKTSWQSPEERDKISDAGRKWLEENAEAIKSMNEYVEKHGLPLAKYRMF